MRSIVSHVVPVVQGELTIISLDRETGNIIDSVVVSNLVVDRAKYTMAHLLGGDTSSRSISKISFGIGDTPPVVTDTGLENELIEVAVSSVTYPTSASVIFEASLTAEQGNAGGISGVIYKEVALKSANGDMFSRVVFAGRPKTNKIAFISRWRLFWS